MIADQSARRRIEDQPHAPAARRAHLDHLAFAFGEFLHDHAGMLLVDIDDDFLDGFEQFARGAVLKQDLRARYGKLETFAPHGLDENAELQFAASGDLHGVSFGRFGNSQRDIAFRLAQQAFADDAALHLVAFGAGERRIVDAKRHGERRRIDRLRRQRLGHFGRAQRVRDRRLGQARDRDDVAGKSLRRSACAPARGRPAPWSRALPRSGRRCDRAP